MTPTQRTHLRCRHQFRGHRAQLSPGPSAQTLVEQRQVERRVAPASSMNRHLEVEGGIFDVPTRGAARKTSSRVTTLMTNPHTLRQAADARPTNGRVLHEAEDAQIARPAPIAEEQTQADEVQRLERQAMRYGCAVNWKWPMFGVTERVSAR